MNHDDWKTQPPPDDKEKECGYCGYECEEEFCSKECEKAYLNDN